MLDSPLSRFAAVALLFASPDLGSEERIQKLSGRGTEIQCHLGPVIAKTRAGVMCLQTDGKGQVSCEKQEYHEREMADIRQEVMPVFGDGSTQTRLQFFEGIVKFVHNDSPTRHTFSPEDQKTIGTALLQLARKDVAVAARIVTLNRKNIDYQGLDPLEVAFSAHSHSQLLDAAMAGLSPPVRFAEFLTEAKRVENIDEDLLNSYGTQLVLKAIKTEYINILAPFVHANQQSFPGMEGWDEVITAMEGLGVTAPEIIAGWERKHCYYDRTKCDPLESLYKTLNDLGALYSALDVDVPLITSDLRKRFGDKAFKLDLRKIPMPSSRPDHAPARASVTSGAVRSPQVKPATPSPSSGDPAQTSGPEQMGPTL